MPSYYHPLLDADSKELILENEEFHHLTRVKRIICGQEIKINSGRGFIGKARISSIDKRKAVLEVLETIYHPKAIAGFAVAFALLKNHHDEMLVEKCTELGAKEFFPLTTQFTVKDLGKNTLSRFEKIALAAIKQCDNPWLPYIREHHALPEAIKTIVSLGYQPVFCSEKENQVSMRDLSGDKDLCFIIGPEGGYDYQELKMIQDYPAIRVSPLICRAETAAIAVSAQYQAVFGLGQK